MKNLILILIMPTVFLFLILSCNREWNNIYDSNSKNTFCLLWSIKQKSTFVSFSPSGSRIISATLNTSDGYAFKVWDSTNGDLLWSGEQSLGITDVDWSYDGFKIVSCAWNDNSVKLWNSETGNINWTKYHLDDVQTVAFSPNGSKVVSGSADNTVKAWNSETGNLLWTGEHLDDVWSVAFSPDGSKVVSGSEDNTIKLWDSENGNLLFSREHNNSSIKVAFSHDGFRIVSGATYPNTVMVLDSENGNLIWINEHSDINETHSTLVAFSPDDSKVVSAGGGYALKVWDSETGNLLWTAQHSMAVVRSITFSPDGSEIASCSSDSDPTVNVWDSATGMLIWSGEHESGAHSLEFSPDGLKIVSGGWNFLKIWDTSICY